MRIQNRGIALGYRLVLLACCTVGLWSTLFVDGQFIVQGLVMYTNLSNIGCWLFFILLTVKTIVGIRVDGWRGSTVFLPRLKGALTVMITVTFLVFAVLLAPRLPSMEGEIVLPENYALTNILLHYITPLMVLFDWLLFDRKQQYSWYEPFVWLTIPFSYLVFALIRAEVGGEIVGMGSRYPYFFLDVDVLGWGGVALWSFGIMLFFLALGYLLLLLDRLAIVDGKLSLKKNNYNNGEKENE